MCNRYLSFLSIIILKVVNLYQTFDEPIKILSFDLYA